MSRPASSPAPVLGGAPLCRHARAGRLHATRLGVRLAPAEPSGSRVPEARLECAADALGNGVRQRGPIQVALRRRPLGESALFEWSLRNTGSETVQVESALLGFQWEGAPALPLRALRHGWQSWSFTGPVALDAAGTAPFPSGEWLRGMHHAAGRPPADRAGWHESDGVGLVGRGDHGAACLAGVLERGVGFGSTYLRRRGAGVAVEVEIRVEVPLAPGESLTLDRVQVALGDDVHALLERFAERWGEDAGARRDAAFQAGWCTWYHFFHDVTEEDLLRNLEALAADRSLGLEVVQLDDGYQREIGDWLETNSRFPRGLAPVAAAIRDAGFVPGLWLAPFCAVPESRLAGEHPEWLLRDGDGPFLGLLHAKWGESGRVLALDASREDVLAHLEGLGRALRERGFDYLELDFLHAGAMRADAADPTVPRAARLRRGLAAFRRGTGEDAFLLGCGCPLGPAVGLVDGMRIGPDVAPTWEPDPAFVIPGLEPVMPSTASALRSVVNRAWMHRRLWLNDPDCLMARTVETGLRPAEVDALSAAIAGTGGMVVVSDDLGHVDETGRERVRSALALARQVDAAGERGRTRALGLLEPEGAPRLLLAQRGDRAWLTALALGDADLELDLDLGQLGLAPGARVERAGGVALRAASGRLRGRLPAHSHGGLCLTGARSLAVFCDFDGTFSVQDVGATLAKQRVPERRAALWDRLVAGEFDAWGYNMELLDGLELPRGELLAFLRSIELDPGAKALLDWCAARSVPFRILSDGFDHNLDALQEMHGVAFEYESNHLRYEGERWRLAPGGPDPACGCGTGTCKRRVIRAWRAAHPGAFCVHVGNGRVSDLCAGLEADRVFAKDTLAPALAERGVAHDFFETLHDVVRALDAEFGV